MGAKKRTRCQSPEEGKVGGARKPVPTRLDIRTRMQIHMVTDGPHSGWVHTHGLAELGLPELELRAVPLLFGASAGRLLNHVAQYLYDGKHGIDGAGPVTLGQTMATEPYCRFKFVKLAPLPGDEEHFRVERWSLSDEPMSGFCDDPECKAHEKSGTVH